MTVTDEWQTLILESLSLKPQCAEFVAQIETERNIAKPAKPAALVEALR